jgi:hypothetical protein
VRDNSGDPDGSGVDIKVMMFFDMISLSGTDIVFDGLHITEVSQDAMIFGSGSTYEIRNCVWDYNGVCVRSNVTSGLGWVHDCILHDGRMVVDTPGGGDDFGAYGIEVLSGSLTFDHNTVYNLNQASYDYGDDGCCFELYCSGDVDTISIHHNNFYDNSNFMEITSAHVVDHVHIYRNLIINSFCVPSCHGDSANPLDLVVENNTYVYYSASHIKTWCVALWVTPQAAGTAIYRNNVYYLSDARRFLYTNGDWANVVHNNNIMHSDDAGIVWNFVLDGTETHNDPGLVDIPGRDYHLVGGSIAIDAGTNTVLAADITDYEDTSVPINSTIDIGAYEHA